MTVVVIGLVMIPYPGPGWLVVFTGLAVLGTEFHWARRVRGFLRRRYDRWTGWLRRQPPGVRLVVIAGTAAAILLTLWLVGTLGLVASSTGLRWSWVRSPLL